MTKWEMIKVTLITDGETGAVEVNIDEEIDKEITEAERETVSSAVSEIVAVMGGIILRIDDEEVENE